MLLPKAKASSDALVVRLKTIGEAHEGHVVTVLKIDPESSNTRFGDQDSLRPTLKGFNGGKLRIRGVTALDFHAIGKKSRQCGAFIVHSTPENPLFCVGLHQCNGARDTLMS